MSQYDKLKWGLHIAGPDSILACHNFQHAVQKCKEINDMLVSMIDETLPHQEYRPIIFAKIYPWNELANDDEHDPENENWDEIC